MSELVFAAFSWSPPLFECSDCGAVVSPAGRDIHKLWHAMIEAEIRKG